MCVHSHMGLCIHCLPGSACTHMDEPLQCAAGRFSGASKSVVEYLCRGVWWWSPSCAAACASISTRASSMYECVTGLVCGPLVLRVARACSLFSVLFPSFPLPIPATDSSCWPTRHLINSLCNTLTLTLAWGRVKSTLKL